MGLPNSWGIDWSNVFAGRRLSFGSNKWEEAAELFTNAGNKWKSIKNWRGAAQAFSRASGRGGADLNIILLHNHSPLRCTNLAIHFTVC